MGLTLVDTHCHLDREPLAGLFDAVLARAEKVGVTRCLSVGTDLSSSRRAIELASRDSRIRAAVGIHPHDASVATAETLEDLEKMMQDPRVVAVGEIGLDFFKLQGDPQIQRRLLHDLLCIASRRELPVLLHCRDAYDALLDELKRVKPGPWSGVIHCASGPPKFIQESLALGLHVSFAGNVTFPKAASLRELVQLVPDDRLLLETDSPFLAPQPFRGKPNEPSYLIHTAECLAQLRGLSVEALAALTSRNAELLFRFEAACG